MTTWEYKTAVVELEASFWGTVNFPKQAIDDGLNEFGRDGWELVSAETSTVAYGQSNRMLLLFKRPKV